MKVSDKKAFVREYFEHAADIRQKRQIDKRHTQMLIKDDKDRAKILKERIKTRVEHEELNAAKKVARQNEVDKRQLFLKLSSALNIV